MPEIIAVRRNLSPGAVFFRQNGTVLEYSLDNVTWSLAYDFGGIGGGVALSVSADYVTAQNNVTNILNSYNGNVSSIAPSLVFAGNGTDYPRDVALCFALDLWFDFLQTGENFSQQAGFANQLGQSFSQVGLDLALAAGGTALTGVGLPLAVKMAVIALGAGFLGFVLQNIDPIISKAHWNADAVANVKCCVYESLKGQTPTATRFANALDPDNCGFAGVGTDERKILDDVAQLLNDRNTYLSFLAIAQQAYGYLTASYKCPCEDRWTHTLDFTGPVFPPDVEIVLTGGLTHQPYAGLTSNVRAQPSYKLNQSFSMFGLRAEYTMTLGAGSTTPYFRSQWIGATAPQFLNFEGNATGVNVVFEEFKTAPLAMNGDFTLDMRPSTLGAGLVVLRKLVIYGQGNNPWS